MTCPARVLMIAVAGISVLVGSRATGSDETSKLPETNRAEAASAPPSAIPNEAPSYYCGLHCVYAAAQALDVQFEFGDIVRSEYLTGRHGSSGSDLLAALKHVGLNGIYRESLTAEHLELIDKPVLLHVRPVSLSSQYSHWILFLGLEEGRARIYDPPREVGDLSMAELQSIWDGGGIIVSKTPHGAFFARIPTSTASLSLISVAAIGMLLLHRRVHSVAMISLTTIMVALVFTTILPTGFCRSPSAINNVRAVFFPKDVPEIDRAKLQSMLDAGKCQLVDARLSTAFERFHLPGAVNIPINAGYLKFKSHLLQIKDSANIVVYCQSVNCGWAESVAHQIASRGIESVWVYRGGVNDWRAQEQTE